MPSILETISRLLPDGANEGEGDVARVPLWPPDLFGVVATLARLSECYTLAGVRGGMGLSDSHCQTCRDVGKRWARLDASVQPWLQERWDVLRKHGHHSLKDLKDHTNHQGLIQALFELLAAADEASSGIGFGGSSATARLARQVMKDNLDASLNKRLNEEEACVQPKGRVPSVGCNLRSMSQHLALVPASTQVTTTHLEAIQPFNSANNSTIGVLLVPFPYRITEDDFESHAVYAAQPWARLKLGCSWHRTPPAELTAFVKDLIATAKALGLTTDVVVFPELALTTEMWEALTAIEGPRLFVAGVLEPSDHDRPPSNVARGYFADGTGQEPLRWRQAKHHRWRIERYQVANYGLRRLRPPNASSTSAPLKADDPAWDGWFGWWEDIDIQERRVVAARFHHGATVSTLICEDLARVDPVQPVLRELGPTWLIALLLDGPQYGKRWSAQGAGAFADDPGSSVLVLSSLALIQENRFHRERGKGGSHARSVSGGTRRARRSSSSYPRRRMRCT